MPALLEIWPKLLFFKRSAFFWGGERGRDKGGKEWVPHSQKMHHQPLNSPLCCFFFFFPVLCQQSATFYLHCRCHLELETWRWGTVSKTCFLSLAWGIAKQLEKGQQRNTKRLQGMEDSATYLMEAVRVQRPWCIETFCWKYPCPTRAADNIRAAGPMQHQTNSC